MRCLQPQVPLGSFDREESKKSKEELDLIQFASGGVARLRAGVAVLCVVSLTFVLGAGRHQVGEFR
jgi:hypothetical protein